MKNKQTNLSLTVKTSLKLKQNKNNLKKLKTTLKPNKI